MAASPIGLFVYKRPEYAARALRALARCSELATSPLVIYCDGPKPTADAAARARIDETRRIVRDLAPAHARVIERPDNLGLAVSMRTGVGELCDEYGRAIILEDDLEVSSTFLRFMSDALDRYVDEPRVMQISGYMFPVEIAGEDDALFVPLISCWGWAVWARSWAKLDSGASWFARLERDAALRQRFDLDDAYPYFEMLGAQHRGEIDSWGIRWYLDVFANDGIVLHPRTSLVANRGHDGSGAHRERSSPFEAEAHDVAVARFPGTLASIRRLRHRCASSSDASTAAAYAHRWDVSCARRGPHGCDGTDLVWPLLRWQGRRRPATDRVGARSLQCTRPLSASRSRRAPACRFGPTARVINANDPRRIIVGANTRDRFGDLLVHDYLVAGS